MEVKEEEMELSKRRGMNMFQYRCEYSFLTSPHIIKWHWKQESRMQSTYDIYHGKARVRSMEEAY